MTNFVDSDHPAAPGLRPHRLRAGLDWLAKPLRAHPTESRREHLLAWLLLCSLFLITVALAIVLIVDSPLSPRRGEYVGLILGLAALAALAYGLNCAGHYSLAAGLTVACGVLGPWGSLWLDPTILRGDFVPLAYVIITVLLSSLLLPPVLTALLSALQLAALALVPLVSPATASINWPSFLALILFTSVLSILSNFIGQQQVDKIDRQARQLADSEAQLRELSVRDHLTQLFNRRYLEESLQREIRRSQRAHYPISVILFDVDHFKRVNDRWGHAAGDLVLQRLAQVALAHIRGGDIACRLGGDEFVLILPEASASVACERAEHLQAEVSQLRVDFNRQSLEPVTLSLGVAVYPAHGDTAEALLHSADSALYRAKHAGRDRVAMAGDL